MWLLNYTHYSVFHQHDLAYEEVMESNGTVGIIVADLLLGQFDIQADRFDTGFVRALVGSFHDTGAAAGHDIKSCLAE